MCNVNIPRKDNSNLELTLKAGKTTIIIGANGSGKTRLAVYLEEQLGEKAHRIAAHRALSLNPNIEKYQRLKPNKGFFMEILSGQKISPKEKVLVGIINHQRIY